MKEHLPTSRSENVASYFRLKNAIDDGNFEVAFHSLDSKLARGITTEAIVACIRLGITTKNREGHAAPGHHRIKVMTSLLTCVLDENLDTGLWTLVTCFHTNTENWNGIIAGLDIGLTRYKSADKPSRQKRRRERFIELEDDEDDK